MGMLRFHFSLLRILQSGGAVIYFDANEAKVDLSYKNNNQVITILDSLLLGNLNTKYITALNVETFVSLMVMNLIIEVWLLGEMIR